jgi:hypothetical protein
MSLMECLIILNAWRPEPGSPWVGLANSGRVSPGLVYWLELLCSDANHGQLTQLR